jgi:hypothetical protein
MGTLRISLPTAKVDQIRLCTVVLWRPRWGLQLSLKDKSNFVFIIILRHISPKSSIVGFDALGLGVDWLMEPLDT